jgi:hypothetical protein
MTNKQVHESKYKVFLWWKRLHGSLRALIVIGLAVSFIAAVFAVAKPAINDSWSSLLVGSIREHVVYPDIFTKERVFQIDEDYLRINTTSSSDYSVSGTFVIPANDMKRLLDAPAPLKCQPASKCKIEQAIHYDESDNPNPGYAGDDGVNQFTLYLYPKENKVEWYYNDIF